MISKNLYLHGNTYNNVDRYMQFADCDNRFFCQDFISNLKNYTCTDTDMNGNIKQCGVKKIQIPVGRDVADGERNTAFIDFDGIYTRDGEPAFIFAPQVRFHHSNNFKGASSRISNKNHSKQTTLMTDCYSQKDIPGIESIMKDGPYGRVCPLTLDTGFLAVNNADSKWIKPKGENWKGETIQYESGNGFQIQFHICGISYTVFDMSAIEHKFEILKE